MNELIQRAALVSYTAHQAIGQKRKYTHQPYYVHPQAVAQMISQVEGATDHMIAAAYLHDVIEDTHLTPSDVHRMFGLVVTNMVMELTDQFTDPAQGNRATRKHYECARLATASAATQTIKYADLIDNTQSIVTRDPRFAPVYLAEKRRLLEAMDKGDRELHRQAWELLTQAEAHLEHHTFP